MGYEYIYIDSKDRKYHETKSQIEVTLSEPILHPKSVRLISLSVANEFHNVVSENQSFSVRLYNVANNTKTPIKNYVIPAGLYSLVELITTLNTSFQDDKVTTEVLKPLSL